MARKKKRFVFIRGKLFRFKDGADPAKFKEKYPDAYLVPTSEPSEKTLRHWMFDGVAKALDGCRVEPDGSCQHGYPSWLRAMGII